VADDPAGAAPAQPTAPPATAPATAPASSSPVSAERAAADADDFGAFDAAHVATRQGKTVPAVPSAPRAATPGGETLADAPAPVSKRQQVINDYERRVVEQEQRIRELELRIARPSAPPPDAGPPQGQPPPAAPKAETAKERAARYLALPDAPKIDDFDTYPEYNAAQTLFIQDRLHAEQAAVQQQHAVQQQRHQALITRDQTFRERLTAAKTADPTFVTSLSEDAKNLGGIDHARRIGVVPGPVHIIGELVYDSPHAVAFLRHISANPDALRALVTPPASVLRVAPQWRAKAHIDHLVTEFRRLEGRLAYEESLGASDTAPRDHSAALTSVSAAPPPPPTLGKAGRSTDPVRSALARDDFEAFDAAEIAKRLQRRSGRAG